MTTTFSGDLDEAAARALDAADDPACRRDAFHLPAGEDGRPLAYFCGNSLGLQPRGARALVEEELDDWARRAVEGHFRARRPWYDYHERFRGPLARVVGAREHEVVAMNTLTVNLHLLMVSLYRPEGARRKVLIESPAFPSDIYAVHTHVATRGLDPADAVVEVGPPAGGAALDDDAIVAAIEREAGELALVLVGGVNFVTGQVLDMPRIVEAAHRAGAKVILDLAHAAGNVPMQLHDWDVDAAAWCSYKYLNGGPGAVAAAFIHERHARNRDLPRYAGWWGNDPETRFRMHLERTFVPRDDADGWQLSNPPILAMAPLIASLELFDEVGMPALRERSQRLTGTLRAALEARAAKDAIDWLEITTPREPERHGCQLSLRVLDRPRERFEALEAAGVLGDFRPPDVIRVAPTPLYGSFDDCRRLVEAVASI